MQEVVIGATPMSNMTKPLTLATHAEAGDVKSNRVLFGNRQLGEAINPLVVTLGVGTVLDC